MTELRVREKVRNLAQQIHDLEDELVAALQQQETRTVFEIHGRRVRFHDKVRRAHQRLRVGVFAWLLASDWRSILSAPVIYSVLGPMLLYDAAFTVYQAICFRLYGIPQVQRSKYIAIDRHNLSYLNAIERLNCIYCGYANGLNAYAREIISRTEQYWCPIKHAHKILGAHGRYAYFLDYGEAEEYPEKLEAYRRELTGDRPIRG